MPLRFIILMILVGFTIWLVVSTIKNKRRVEKTRIISLVLLGLLIGQQGWMEYQWIKQESIMAASVTTVAGDGIDVNCQRFAEALFFTRNNLGEVKFGEDGFPERSAMLTWQTCRDLREFLNSDRKNPTNEQYIALHVLTHEAVHMAGDKMEGTTECYSLQLTPLVAKQFGVPEEVADEKARWYYSEVYPTLRSEYRDTRCVNDGPLDLSPESVMWPRAAPPVDLPSDDARLAQLSEPSS